MDAEQMDFPDASFDKVVAMYVVSVVERPGKLLEELHRVLQARRRNLHRQPFPVREPHHRRHREGAVGFSSTLGFHPDFKLHEVLPAGHNGEVSMSRVNLFWKIIRLRNGVKHRKV
jgi:phosphatidylethanolamine/phosphatidyl-N-methylethanolamine N-methyltransferase